MGLQGNLKEMAIADLIQVNCQEKKTASLVLSRANESATLYFKDGAIVHAVLNGTAGEESVYPLLAWEDGAFDLQTGIEAPATTIKRSWSSLLIEGARRLDEGTLSVQNIDLNKNESEGEKMSQKLDELLQSLSGEVNGYIASSIVGMDGMSIASHTTGKSDPDAISAQMTMLVKLVDTSITKSSLGSLEDTILTAENAYLYMRFLPENSFFLGIVADRRTASLGNLRLIGKIYTDRVEKSMPQHK